MGSQISLPMVGNGIRKADNGTLSAFFVYFGYQRKPAKTILLIPV